MINSSSHLFAHKVCCQPCDLISPGFPIPDWHKYLMITFIMFCTSLCACKLFIYYASLAAIGLESTPGLSWFLMWSYSLASGTPFFPGTTTCQIRCVENFLILCFAEWMSLLHTTSRLGAKAVLELLWNSKVYLRYDISSSQQSVDPLGVAQISGGSFFLRSRLKRLRSPFQDTPVYMVTCTSLSSFKELKSSPSRSVRNITKKDSNI